MSPSTDRRPVLVGLFVAVAIAILAGGILAVGNLRDTFTQKITVHATFKEVNGLKSGDNVWCSGLKVGVVRSLRFVAISQVEVEMQLGEEVSRYIHRDALAHIGSDGLIGNAIVVVTGGTADAPPIAEGDTLQVETTVSTSDVLAMLQENNKNLLAITTDIKGITGKLSNGEGTVGRLLSEDDLYDNLTHVVDTLQGAAGNARRLTASLATFSAQLNEPGNLPHDLATNTTLMPSIATSLQQVQDATARAKEAVDGLARGAEDPATPVGALLHDTKTASELKTTIANLRSASKLLEEDLTALQSNFLFRGYFKKKEKAAKRAAEDAAEAAEEAGR